MKPDGRSYMVPQYDVMGNLTKMRYIMTEHTKDTVLQQNSEFDRIMGAMASQIVDKSMTPEINKELIIELKALFDSEEYGFDENAGEFVEISPFSSNKRYRDIYAMLPPKAQQQVESIWGSHKMMVPIDVVDLAFGQRKYTIIEFNFTDLEVIDSTTPYHFPITTFGIAYSAPSSDRGRPGQGNRWEVFSASMRKLLGEDGDIRTLEGKMQEWHKKPGKVRMKATLIHFQSQKCLMKITSFINKLKNTINFLL